MISRRVSPPRSPPSSEIQQEFDGRVIWGEDLMVLTLPDEAQKQTMENIEKTSS